MTQEGISPFVSCVFCNIAQGYEPASIRLQDDEFVAFDDLFPKADTHVIVIPRAHHPDLDCHVAAGGSSDRMLSFVGRVARELGIHGAYRLFTNVGADAGQMIFHLHWHLVAGELRPL